MKKIFAILIAAAFMFMALSCSDASGAENEKPENDGTNTEQSDTTDDAPDAPQNGEGASENGAPQAISYEKFKEIIGYSMAPYDTPANVEKNMVHAVTGYNGDVELTYFSFVLEKNAAEYFDEIKSYFPEQVVMSEEDGNYEICKIEDGEYFYLVVRIDNTIIYGSCKDGYESLNNWFYGLGYVAGK